ncbi:MAG TPA: CfrBI family restriction endonuclease [Candidatus Wunengus sp. YC61]|uniref:CfrBI family restriction endonuclease n=1 Tax=Candidatus Wunengus sp. YC61 TaxID=3367698 RepID=UPI004025FEB6
MPKKKNKLNSLTELISPKDIDLLSASGSQLVEQIGLDVVRGVVLDILKGKNLRDSTESLTRRRIATLNLATMELFIKGSANSKDFLNQLPKTATDILSKGNLSKAERWLAQWILGLTDKAFQNVLRDDPDAIAGYRDRYIQICDEVIAARKTEKGTLQGEITINGNQKAQINWLWMTYLLNTIGAQTLAIRGSEKSAYGKLFEKLVLGSLLHILGFKQIIPPPQEYEKVFWLTSRNEKRESDATLLYELGQSVRFDIGFIGRGNPEISLDKVTRFEREISLGRSKFFMATIILVDRIGTNSRIERMAKEVQGTIIQMSAGYWPKQVAQVLNKTLGFKHDLTRMNDSEIEKYLQNAMRKVPLEQFIGLSENFGNQYVKEEEAQSLV